MKGISWTASELLVLSILIYRLYAVTYPLKSTSLSTRLPHKVALIIFIVATVFSFYLAFLPGEASDCAARALFHIKELCPTLEKSKKFSELNFEEETMMLVILMFYLVYLAILITNGALMCIAVKYAQGLRRSCKKALVTTLLVGALFLLTWTSFIVWITIMIILRVYVELGHEIDSRWSGVVVHIELADALMYCIGTYGNPVIYTCINQKFRRFTVTKLRLLRDRIRSGCRGERNWNQTDSFDTTVTSSGL